MNRREFIGFFAVGTTCRPLQALAAPADLRSAAREAWTFCLPLIETARVRAHVGEFAPSASAGAGLDAFIHSRDLATPAERLVTSPNVDTLYSMAFIDLANGPATIILPTIGARYFSLHLMDMYTNSFAVVGARTLRGGAGAVMLVGPRAAGPPGAIRAPTPWVFAMVRIGVYGPDDLDAPHAIQQGLALKAARPRPFGVFADRHADWREYFASASALLAESPPLSGDAALVERIAPLGLAPPQRFDPSEFASDEEQAIEAGIEDAKGLMRERAPEAPVDGWRYPKVDLGDFGQDYVFRARVAVSGLAALPRSEAMYMRAVAPDGAVRFRGGDWRLSFPPGQLPPVNAFWSLTMYEASAEGQLFLAENPLRRYSIGDRSRGLGRNADGSLDIWIGRTNPGEARMQNWLPAPASGPFVMTMRAYLPKSALLDGRYRLPPVAPA